MSSPDSSSETPNQAPSIHKIKEGMRTTWMGGDYRKIAAIVANSAEEFVKRVSPAQGAHVLDVACGTGNVTLPLARLLKTGVTGVDIAPNLLDEARRRADAEHLHITFDEGDAEALPYPDASIDAVFSMFGAMFAPRPELVVTELARVLRPGGTLALANWTPSSFTASILRVTSKYAPPLQGIPSPLQWGDEATVRTRLEPAFREIRTEPVPLDFDLPMSPVEAAALFREFYGPTKAAFNRIDDNGKMALGADLDALWSNACVSPTPETHTTVKNEYLLVTAVRAQ